MKTKNEPNRTHEDVEAANIQGTEMSDEALAHVEGGSWFGRRKITEPVVVPPMAGPPSCFSGKDNRRPMSVCPSPALCPYREGCANHNSNATNYSHGLVK